MEFSPLYFTQLGQMYLGDAYELLDMFSDESIHLVITSPPFALQRQKEYGNVNQDDFVEWLMRFARKVYTKLRQDGSFVLDLGGAYQKGRPVRSLYNYRVLLSLCDQVGFNLAEEFFWYNPAKLPSPIEWVNKRKIRVKDAVNPVWWLSKSDFPKTRLNRVLIQYSARMQKLLKDSKKYYEPKLRPSGHDIGEAFSKDNGGAIPSNLLEIPNTESNSRYLRLCRLVGVHGHPARFPSKLPEFFIKFLSDPGDIVVDIFAGSNTTGAVAEMLGRRWIAFELSLQYAAASIFRFEGPESELIRCYREILEGKGEVEVPKDKGLEQVKFFS